jgi:hypothetical protein
MKATDSGNRSMNLNRGRFLPCLLPTHSPSDRSRAPVYLGIQSTLGGPPSPHKTQVDPSLRQRSPVGG